MSNDPQNRPPTRATRYRHLDFSHHGTVSPRLAVGLVIITLGVIYLADSLGIMGAHRPERFFWPAIFVAIGVTLLIEKKTLSSRYWAYGWLFAGFIEFSYQVYWIPVGIGKLIFPLVLVFVGARLVQRAMNTSSNGGNGVALESGASSLGTPTRVFAILSGSETRAFTQPLKDAEAISIMSGIKLDLTTATIEGDRATLQVTAIMGGIEIFAPSEWTIVSEVTPVLGAYIDKRRPTATPATKTLFISGVVIMGGIEVKN